MNKKPDKKPELAEIYARMKTLDKSTEPLNDEIYALKMILTERAGEVLIALDKIWKGNYSDSLHRDSIDSANGEFPFYFYFNDIEINTEEDPPKIVFTECTEGYQEDDRVFYYEIPKDFLKDSFMRRTTRRFRKYCKEKIEKEKRYFEEDKAFRIAKLEERLKKLKEEQI